MTTLARAKGYKRAGERIGAATQSKSSRCARGEHNQCQGFRRGNHGLKPECRCDCGHPHLVEITRMKIKGKVLQMRCSNCNKMIDRFARGDVDRFLSQHQRHAGFTLLIEVHDPEVLAGLDVAASTK